MKRPSRSHNEAPVRLFQNEILERLTQISFRTFVLVWSALLLVLLIVGGKASHSYGAFLLATGSGFVVWFVVEYFTHRFLFHLQLRSRIGQALIFMLHGNHHVQPNHPLRNLMPLGLSIPLAGLLWAGGVMIGGMGNGGCFIDGFIMGYVIYDVVHYACHQFPMRLPVLRSIKKHHVQHHYVAPESNFAITAIFLDRVFRTKIH